MRPASIDRILHSETSVGRFEAGRLPQYIDFCIQKFQWTALVHVACVNTLCFAFRNLTGPFCVMRLASIHGALHSGMSVDRFEA